MKEKLSENNTIDIYAFIYHSWFPSILQYNLEKCRQILFGLIKLFLWLTFDYFKSETFLLDLTSICGGLCLSLIKIVFCDVL